MKGLTLRMELLTRDIENDNFILVRRDLGEKMFFSKQDVLSVVPKLLEKIQIYLFTQAKEFRDVNTHSVSTYDEFCSYMKTGGFVRCGWDGSPKTELKIKEEQRLLLDAFLLMKNLRLRCVLWKPAKHEVIFARPIRLQQFDCKHFRYCIKIFFLW